MSQHPDAEILAAAGRFLALAEALDNAPQITPEDTAAAEAITDAMQPELDTLRALRATTLEGVQAKARVALYWQPTADHAEAEEIGWATHSDLVRDLLALSGKGAQ